MFVITLCINVAICITTGFRIFWPLFATKLTTNSEAQNALKGSSNNGLTTAQGTLMWNTVCYEVTRGSKSLYNERGKRRTYTLMINIKFSKHVFRQTWPFRIFCHKLQKEIKIMVTYTPSKTTCTCNFVFSSQKRPLVIQIFLTTATKLPYDFRMNCNL
jgi:hypothetical protein